MAFSTLDRNQGQGRVPVFMSCNAYDYPSLHGCAQHAHMHTHVHMHMSCCSPCCPVLNATPTPCSTPLLPFSSKYHCSWGLVSAVPALPRMSFLPMSYKARGNEVAEKGKTHRQTSWAGLCEADGGTDYSQPGTLFIYCCVCAARGKGWPVSIGVSVGSSLRL